MRLRSKLGVGTVVRVTLPRDPRQGGDSWSRRGLMRYYSSVGATSRATCTSAAISGVIGSRCGITRPML